MKLFTISSAALALAAYSYAHVITSDDVSCYSGPDNSTEVHVTYNIGHDVSVDCLAPGTFGDANWSKTEDGCYLPEQYFQAAAADVAQCQDVEEVLEMRELLSRSNDYPYKGKCSGEDPWRFYRCQCTSFVAWRLNDKLGIKFDNRYKGYHWSHGKTWDEAARATGVKINKTPKVKAVAQLNRKLGHVAWVTKVSGGEVTVEEYNWNKKEGYGTRTVSKTSFDNYIHFQ